MLQNRTSSAILSALPGDGERVPRDLAILSPYSEIRGDVWIWGTRVHHVVRVRLHFYFWVQTGALGGVDVSPGKDLKRNPNLVLCCCAGLECHKRTVKHICDSLGVSCTGKKTDEAGLCHILCSLPEPFPPTYCRCLAPAILLV